MTALRKPGLKVPEDVAFIALEQHNPEWGGAAMDPDGILFFNAHDMPSLLKLMDTSAHTLGGAISCLSEARPPHPFMKSMGGNIS